MRSGAGREGTAQGDAFLISLDPTRGGEIQRTRQCVVVSADELNDHLSALLVAPMTAGGHRYPFRLPCRCRKAEGYVVPDQLRTVDSDRLVRRLGRLHPNTRSAVLAVRGEMFEE